MHFNGIKEYGFELSPVFFHWFRRRVLWIKKNYFQHCSLISIQKIQKNFPHQNEASQSNKHLHKKIIIKPPFMHSVYRTHKGNAQPNKKLIDLIIKKK